MSCTRPVIYQGKGACWWKRNQQRGRQKDSKIRRDSNARKCIFETKCVKHKIKTEGNQKKLREPEVAEELYL